MRRYKHVIYREDMEPRGGVYLLEITVAKSKKILRILVPLINHWIISPPPNFQDACQFILNPLVMMHLEFRCSHSWANDFSTAYDNVWYASRISNVEWRDDTRNKTNSLYHLHGHFQDRLEEEKDAEIRYFSVFSGTIEQACEQHVKKISASRRENTRNNSSTYLRSFCARLLLERD